VAPANLLLVSLDTVRADRLGIYGYSSAATPTLDRIGREGARFTSVSSAVPLTLPSHATILTGLLPPQHGVRLNGLGRLPAENLTLTEHLAGQGFETAAFVGAFVLDHRFGLDQGFGVYDDQVARPASGQAPRLEAERPADQVIDRALAWLAGRKEPRRPFFLFVHLYDAHAPYAPPEPWLSRFEGRPYDGEIAFADSQLGRLLQQLEQEGALDSTLVAVAADHGESLGEHGEETHGLLLYEPALHVPLLLRAPGAVPAGLTIEAEAGLVDLAPTLAALLGRPLPAPGAPAAQGRSGRDLGPLLAGEALPPRPLYAETEYPAAFGWSPLAAARQDGLKLILSPRPELFDLRRDPGEKNDRKEEERRSLRQLEAAAREIRQAARTADAAGIDAEARSRLASLGYAAPAGKTLARQLGEGAHPLDRLADFHRWELLAEQSRGPQAAAAFAPLSALVAADPGNPVFRASLARLARQLGKSAEALELYRRAIADAPGDPDAWQDLAAVLNEQGKSRESGAAASQALALDPRRPEALTLLALAELAEGRPREAMQRLAAALELDPKSATARVNLANLLRAGGQPAAAEAEYRRALETAPRLADALNGLGALRVEADRPGEAIPLFEKALEIEENFAEARLNLGIAVQLAGDSKRAQKIWRELLQRTAGQPGYAAERQAALALLDLQHP
jgi:choline-sulfatase